MFPKSTAFLSSLVASTVTSNTRISGFVVSTILTFCSTVDTSPDESVAVQVTIVSPTGKNSGASLVMDSIPTLSDTDGVSRVTVFSSFDVASWVYQTVQKLSVLWCPLLLFFEWQCLYFQQSLLQSR
jgi:hypothetical protein